MYNVVQLVVASTRTCTPRVLSVVCGVWVTYVMPKKDRTKIGKKKREKKLKKYIHELCEV